MLMSLILRAEENWPKGHDFLTCHHDFCQRGAYNSILDKPTFCGTITEARYAARERCERKLMVVVIFGIMGYTGYVYICGTVLCGPHAWRSAAGGK
jgi:hypothetical protein